MATHTLSRSTRTVELDQVLQINDRLRLTPVEGTGPGITAETLGLTGATVDPWVLDRAASLVIPLPERRRTTPAPAAGAALVRLLATGAPTAPYLYGVFAESGGRRELPVRLHTDHLRAISSLLRLPGHLWGV